MEQLLLNEIISIAVSGVLGIVGGVTRFFFDVDKCKRKFSIVGFVSMVLTAFIAGVAVFEAIPSEYNLYGVTMIAGFYADFVLDKISKKYFKN